VKEKLKSAFAITKTATASVGKFDDKLADEFKVKNRGKIRQRDPVSGDMAAEKQRSLALLAKIHKKPVTINTRKGARAADDQAPGGVGKSKVKKQEQQTRFAAKGPSKRQKKQGVK
jgi:regulator of ribosome biosynthesis